MEVEGTREVEKFDVHDMPGTVGFRYKVAKPGDDQYALLMSSVSAQFHEKSYILPARDLQMVLERDRLNKGTKLPNVAGLCLKNPDTTTGMCVASAQVKIMLDLQQAKVQRESDAVDKAEQNKLKNADLLMKRKELALVVISKAREFPETWKAKVSVALLKAAYQFLVPKSKRPSKTPTKKDDLFSHVKDYVIVLAAKEHGNDGDDLSGEESDSEVEENPETK